MHNGPETSLSQRCCRNVGMKPRRSKFVRLLRDREHPMALVELVVATCAGTLTRQLGRFFSYHQPCADMLRLMATKAA